MSEHHQPVIPQPETQQFERQTLTIPEVAQILGCSRGSAYRYARQGRLPALRIGRRFVVPRHSFDRWFNSSAEPLIESQLTPRDDAGTQQDPL